MKPKQAGFLTGVKPPGVENINTRPISPKKRTLKKKKTVKLKREGVKVEEL